VADDLMKNYQHVIEELAFIMSTGGAFEVSVDDQLVFSKKTRERRHAEAGEILERFREIVGPDVPIYGT
jgi:selT/selW/selH-like putative selenoprotein